MKIYRFEANQILPMNISDAWTFFSNPNNLSLITPPQLNFKIKTKLNEKIYAGMIIDYTVSPVLKFPLTWVTEITHVNEPIMFIDEQRFGPYKFWHHEHKFKQTNRGVGMSDIVTYALYGGITANVINDFIVKKKLREIFDYRRKIIEQKFGMKKV